jgi:hypothetical protein
MSDNDYRELDDINKVVDVVDEFIMSYNSFSKMKINIVLFDDAI